MLNKLTNKEAREILQEALGMYEEKIVDQLLQGTFGGVHTMCERARTYALLLRGLDGLPDDAPYAPKVL